jgi:hypothetical protein
LCPLSAIRICPTALGITSLLCPSWITCPTALGITSLLCSSWITCPTALGITSLLCPSWITFPAYIFQSIILRISNFQINFFNIPYYDVFIHITILKIKSIYLN